MTSIGPALAASAGAIVALMLVTWIISVIVRNASIVDLVWGLGFVLVAWTAAVVAGEVVPRTVLVVAMASVWGLRLSIYLSIRNIGKGEDYRYVTMRSRWGDRFWLVSLFSVFLFQGLLMWVVSLPLQVTPAVTGGSVSALDVIGLLVWATGLFFETVGDWQLAAFKRDPANKGRVMSSGLWRYTRHPNYFGDFLVWWGIYTVALATGTAWWTAVGPLLMSFLLIRVSGVALLEKTIGERRAGYAEYVARTSAFFPRPPKE